MPIAWKNAAIKQTFFFTKSLKSCSYLCRSFPSAPSNEGSCITDISRRKYFSMFGIFGLNCPDWSKTRLVVNLSSRLCARCLQIVLVENVHIQAHQALWVMNWRSQTLWSPRHTTQSTNISSTSYISRPIPVLWVGGLLDVCANVALLHPWITSTWTSVRDYLGRFWSTTETRTTSLNSQIKLMGNESNHH